MLMAGAVLLSLAACASQAPQPQTQSILEVLDQANSAPASSQQKPTCGGNEVTYCEVDLGAKHCACKDSGDVNRWLGRMYGSR
jgi:hypothetical protein